MDPKPPADRKWLAPASEGSAAQTPGAWPRVDERLVEPETRAEVVRGRSIVAQPANPPHADRHIDLDFLLRGCIAPGYVGSTDLLTRLGPGSDFATDTCIRKAGVDPATGARYLEELAFEVVGEQSLKEITERAQDLAGRGVRRVFAVFVKLDEVREWSRATNAWTTLAPSSSIVDPTLACPLPVAALLDAADPESAVAQALRAKKNPVLEAFGSQREAEGHAQGETSMGRRMLFRLLQARGLELDEAQRARIDACDDPTQLERWAEAAQTATSSGEVFET